MIDQIKTYLSKLNSEDLIEEINKIKEVLFDFSPVSHNPVDKVLWVKSSDVYGNNYNPNSVAPPEMKLLKDSVLEDGFTQPIVTYRTLEGYEIVDGFHRSRVALDSDISESNGGLVPIVVINDSTSTRDQRIASTIRHNKARGEHAIEPMASIVTELKNRNWTDNKIANKIGMELNDVVRLSQVAGIARLVESKEFSQGWEYSDD